MKPEITKNVGELQELYRNSRISPVGVSKHFFGKLEAACESFDEFLYVVANLNSDRKNNLLLKFIRSAAELAETIEQIRAIWPFVPLSWKSERRSLFLKAANLSTTREELYGIIIEFELF